MRILDKLKLSNATTIKHQHGEEIAQLVGAKIEVFKTLVLENSNHEHYVLSFQLMKP